MRHLQAPGGKAAGTDLRDCPRDRKKEGAGEQATRSAWEGGQCKRESAGDTAAAVTEECVLISQRWGSRKKSALVWAHPLGATWKV